MIITYVKGGGSDLHKISLTNKLLFHGSSVICGGLYFISFRKVQKTLKNSEQGLWQRKTEKLP